MLTLILSLALTGLIVGALGRLAIPGPNPMGIVTTILLGIAGAVLGGLASVALGIPERFGFIVAVLMAALLVYAVSGASRGTFWGGRRYGGFAGRRRSFF